MLNGSCGAVGLGMTTDHSGSSAAAPLVAGVMALVLEANPELSWRDVQHILVNSATMTDSGSSTWHLNAANHSHSHVYGFGVVDATAAVLLAESWTSVGPQVQYTGDTHSLDNQAITNTFSATQQVSAHTGTVIISTLEHVQVHVKMTRVFNL